MNSMDEHNRMMHPTSAMLPQPYGMSSVDPNHGAPTPPDQDTRKQDIGEILQQIMNITDQSLDEAQARYLNKNGKVGVKSFEGASVIIRRVKRSFTPFQPWL